MPTQHDVIVRVAAEKNKLARTPQFQPPYIILHGNVVTHVLVLFNIDS